MCFSILVCHSIKIHKLCTIYWSHCAFTDSMLCCVHYIIISLFFFIKCIIYNIYIPQYNVCCIVITSVSYTKTNTTIVLFFACKFLLSKRCWFFWMQTGLHAIFWWQTIVENLHAKLVYVLNAIIWRTVYIQTGALYY